MGYVQSVRWFAALLLVVVALLACAPQAASQVNIPPTASSAEGSGQPAMFTDPFA